MICRTCRFSGAIEFLKQQVFRIKCRIKSQLLSAKKQNVCYLVFKLSDKCPGLHGPVMVRDLFHWRSKQTRTLYFRSPNLWNLHHNDSIAKKRKDGWMEVILWKYNVNYGLTNDHLFVHLKLVTYEGTMAGLIVRNIEFR
ncbi:putative phloem protein [Helianthus anomalus]